MYTGIIVPLDGSKNAEKVLPYAQWLASCLNVRIEIVLALNSCGLLANTNSGKVDRNSLPTAEKYLERIVQSFPGINTSCTLEGGTIDNLLITKARADENRLIAMVADHRFGMRRSWLSLDRKTICAVDNHLFLVPAKARGAGIQVVPNLAIVPLDGSRLDESVLPSVIRFAKAGNLHIRLCRAYTMADLLYNYETYPSSFEELEAKSREEASRYLEEKTENLKAAGLTQVTSLVVRGTMTEIISRVSKAVPYSFVLMYARNGCHFGRRMLGSNIKRVISDSDKPVFLIRL